MCETEGRGGGGGGLVATVMHQLGGVSPVVYGFI